MKSPAVAIPVGFAIATSEPAPARAEVDFGAILAGARAAHLPHASATTSSAGATRAARVDTDRATREDQDAAAPSVDSTFARQLAVAGGMPAGPSATVVPTDEPGPISTTRESTFSTADAGAGANANVFTTRGDASASVTHAVSTTFSTATVGASASGKGAATADTRTRATPAMPASTSDANASFAARPTAVAAPNAIATATPEASTRPNVDAARTTSDSTAPASPRSNASAIPTPNANVIAIPTAKANANVTAIPTANAIPNAAPALRDSRLRVAPAVDASGRAKPADGAVAPKADHAPDVRGAPATRLEGGRGELPDRLGRDASVSEQDDAPATFHVVDEATPPVRPDAHASLPSHDALTPPAIAVAPPRDDAPTPTDGRLTVHDEKPTVAHDDGIAERVRSAAMSASDAHAIRRGARADVDLGSDGRLTISAEKPHAVRIDADVSATARTLEHHAPELAADLRERGAGDVRVTIGGPATSSTFAGDSGRSRRDDRERSDADPSAPEGTTTVSSTRVRIVL